MIIVVSRFGVAPGKRPEATKWAKRLNDYIEKKGLFGSSPVTFLQPRTGDWGEFFLMWQFSSVSEYDEAFHRLFADPGAMEIGYEQRDWYLGMRHRIFDVIE